MAKHCIMCEKATGSKEHVFPAAFGRRRMNKSIYCHQHNEDVRHHVNELMPALVLFINRCCSEQSQRRSNKYAR